MAIRSALEQLWADRASREVIQVEDALARVTADYRARSMLLALVAAMCLPLAVAGLVGSQMDVVRQRSREIAIRLALGADAAGVRQRLVARAMLTVGLGVVAGVACGVVAGRLMSAHLFGVGALDLPSAVIASVVLLGAAWMGAAWPARRAARIDPAVALRGE
jgi:ABC-type antimicrobial peptide transport system permease subunit